jgi:hypothetical protein
LGGPNEFKKKLEISDEALITLLKLLDPQQLRLSINRGCFLDFMGCKSVFSYLTGIFHADF